jgi:hypothetical protein
MSRLVVVQPLQHVELHQHVLRRIGGLELSYGPTSHPSFPPVCKAK